jgi:radical SAM enzyme (TIGR01210 family)
MTASIEEAISELAFEPHTVVLSPSGSFFDEWEVKAEARSQILEILVSRLPHSNFIFETHSENVTRKKLDECLTILQGRSFHVEMGLESAHPVILRYCLNKDISLRKFQETLFMIQGYPNIGSYVNILIGLPFLNRLEVVREACETIQWAFDHGAERYVLFPVNIKPYTFAYWLNQNSLYRSPSLWTLIDVLTEIPGELLSHTEIAWYKEQDKHHPMYTEGISYPTTCERCYDQVVALLGKYTLDIDRKSTLAAIDQIQCSCRDHWNNMVIDMRPLKKRLQEAYELAAIDILGQDFWAHHKKEIVDELEKIDF